MSLPDASVVHLDHVDLVEDGQDLRHGNHATWLGLRTGQQEKKDEQKETEVVEYGTKGVEVRVGEEMHDWSGEEAWGCVGRSGG